MQVPDVVLCEEKACCSHGHLTGFSVNIGPVFTRSSDQYVRDPAYVEALQLVFRAADSQGRNAGSGSSRAGNCKAKERWRLCCKRGIREVISRGRRGRWRCEGSGLNMGLWVCSMLFAVDL